MQSWEERDLTDAATWVDVDQEVRIEHRYEQPHARPAAVDALRRVGARGGPDARGPRSEAAGPADRASPVRSGLRGRQGRAGLRS
ncbi:hypothetical protein [Streptomyces sp. AcH 505]|uniref:hypothetical protein n=1 Tax=Streptomyces sp. AcH 505 TaxID=352211 RepID=UPI0012FE8AA9